MLQFKSLIGSSQLRVVWTEVDRSAQDGYLTRTEFSCWYLPMLQFRRDFLRPNTWAAVAADKLRRHFRDSGG